MPYSQLTLAQLTSSIQVLLDDATGIYWPTQQVQYAVWEGLRVWGAITSYWRARGAWNATPSQGPWWDLSQLLPTLRPRTYTLGQLVQEIQYDLLEQPSFTGVNASGQVPLAAIISAVVRARNRFVLDVRFPLAIVNPLASPSPPVGMVSFDQSVVFVHRASWQDTFSGAWTNLWREDEWAFDHNNPLWTVQPGFPRGYSEASTAPLQLQLIPPPQAVGIVEGVVVQTSQINVASPTSLLGLPDEWVWAVKYAALADILTSGDQIADPIRAKYCEERYQQGISFAKDAKSVFRVMANGLPLALDTLTSLDAGFPAWRNTVGFPSVAGAMYDLVVTSPRVLSALTGFSADVVQAAPIPAIPGNFVPLGAEDIDHLTNYCIHVLQLKCGGDEFQATFSNYDQWLGAVASRKGVNQAKIRYLKPLFEQPQREWAQRLDRVEAAA